MAESSTGPTEDAAGVPLWVRWTVAVFGIVCAVLLVLFAPRLLVPIPTQADLGDVADAAKRHELQDSRRKLQNDVRTTLVQGLAGAAVLLGGYFTYQQVKTGRDQLKAAREQAQDSDRQAREQLEVAARGQVTERFTRAIDQLGHANLDVRVGGIYALERIARDSPEDRAAVAEVLMAFVRGHAPWPPNDENTKQPPEDAAIDSLPSLRSWAADVQAALTVLGRQSLLEGSLPPLDLRGSDLRGADLSEARLRGANLAGVHLEGANLLRARLQGASLMGAKAQHARLVEAQLEKQDGLERSDLFQAQLQGADLRRAQLQEAFLTEAQLQSASLRDAQLQGAQLQGANLAGAQLQGATYNLSTNWPDGFDPKAANAELRTD